MEQSSYRQRCFEILALKHASWRRKTQSRREKDVYCVVCGVASQRVGSQLRLVSVQSGLRLLSLHGQPSFCLCCLCVCVCVCVCVLAEPTLRGCSGTSLSHAIGSAKVLAQLEVCLFFALFVWLAIGLNEFADLYLILFCTKVDYWLASV